MLADLLPEVQLCLSHSTVLCLPQNKIQTLYPGMICAVCHQRLLPPCSSALHRSQRHTCCSLETCVFLLPCSWYFFLDCFSSTASTNPSSFHPNHVPLSSPKSKYFSHKAFPNSFNWSKSLTEVQSDCICSFLQFRWVNIYRVPFVYRNILGLGTLGQTKTDMTMTPVYLSLIFTTFQLVFSFCAPYFPS